MKRFFTVLIMALLTSAAIAQDIQLSAGAYAAYAPVWTNTQNLGEPSSLSFNAFSVGAFVDATYLQLGLGYASTIGDARYEDDDSSYDVDVSMSAFELSLIAKYPFVISSRLKVFPMFGLQYHHLVSYVYEGYKFSSDMMKEQELNDLYIAMGGGADLTLSDFIYVRPSALYAINITAKDGQRADAEKFYWASLKVGIAVGLKF